MNLDHLKPAWRQFVLFNSLQAMEQDELLLLIEKAEGKAVARSYRFVLNAVVFVTLIVCCQGG